MRISDWSSDVCSSDLPGHRARDPRRARPARHPRAARQCRGEAGRAQRPDARSEEHTSELQSLMRISYAVFCLKKKKKYIRTKRDNQNSKIENITTIYKVKHTKHNT